MIPLRCINNPSLNNSSNLSFITKKGIPKQSKNINLSNLLVCDDAAMIERISLNQGLHSTQRNVKTSKGTSRKKAFSKGDRFKILNQQLYTEQDFNSLNNYTMGDETHNNYKQFDVKERCMTSDIRSSKNSNRPLSQEIQRFKNRNEEGNYLNKNYNNIPTPMMNSFVNTTPVNKDIPQYIPTLNDKENQDSIQKLQLFIKPSYIKQRDYLSIDVRSRNQSIGEGDKSIKNQGNNTLTLHQTDKNDGNDDRYNKRRTSNSCMGKYTIDIPEAHSVANSQTIQFQEKGIRSITPSIISTSTHAQTLTLNKSFSKGKKSLQTSKNGSLLNQSSYKKKLKILQKKESKSPKPHEIMPFNIQSSYSRNLPLRVSKNPDLKMISILGAYLFSIKVEDLEEESVDIQRYIRKKANQAKRIKKCISVLLNYTKSKRDARKLKSINQKCSEYDSLLKTINVIHTLKMRVEGYLINTIQKSSPIKTRDPESLQQASFMGRSNLHTSHQGNRNENYVKKNLQNINASKIQINDQMQQNQQHQNRDIQSSQQQRNSSISTHLFTATNYDQDPSRALSRRINMDLSDDDFEISQSRVNSEGINLYDKRRSYENQQFILQKQQQTQQANNQIKVSPESNVTPLRSNKSQKQDGSDFYQMSENINNNNNDTINFQKDVVNVKSLKPISINNEEDQQKNTINQASVDNMIKNGSVNTNYQGSFMGNTNSSDKQQSLTQFQNKVSLNSQIEEEREADDTPKTKSQEEKIQPIKNKKQIKPQLKFESLEKVIKETIAEQSMSVKHKNIFQNYIDSIKIPLEDLQKQGEDAQHIFEIFNDLMEQFEKKIQDHARNCNDLNKWDILLQYLKDFSLLIDETVKLGSELMKLSQSKALPLTVTNRAVVYLQEAQEKYREVQGKVKDNLKELVNHLLELIEEGIHLNSSDKDYEEVFKFMADIRDSIKQSQVNDYQNKEKLQTIDDIALSLNEMYKISFNIQGMVAKKQLLFVDSPSFSIIKDIKNRCHEFKGIYRNMMERLAILGDNQLVQNINRQSLSQNTSQRKSVNQSIQAISTILAEREQMKGERRDENGQLIGISLIEKQCEEIEDLFEINRWFVSNSQDIDNLIIFDDPQKIPEVYPANEEGKRRFFSETNIGVGVLLQLRENAEDIIDISGSQNLKNIIKSVRLASEKYQQIADISIAAAELCNLQNFISPSSQYPFQSSLENQDQQSEKKESRDAITHIYECLDKLKVQNKDLLENNQWFNKFVNRLINGTLYFDFIVEDYTILCENMHSILSEYSSRSKYSIPPTESFYKRKSAVELKVEKVRKNNHLCENGIAPAIFYKLSFLEQRIAFAVNLFGSNNFVLPNGTLLCKILDAFFERIVHAKPFTKLSEQFEKLRIFMLKGIDIICKEKEVLCSKNSNSSSTGTISGESEEDQNSNGQRQRKNRSSSYYYPQQKNHETEPSSKSTNTTTGGNISINPLITSTAQSALKPQNRSHTPTSSGFKKVPVLKELRFEQEEGSISTQGKNSSTDHIDRFTGRVHYYDNILEEAENLCKHCSLFIPSREDENTEHKQDGDYVQNFSIYVYEDFMQLCSKYLLAKRDKVNIYSNLQLRIKWIAPYNEEYSIFQQKYSFIQKYILPSDANISQETIIEYTKHINQVFHKNGPIFYKYDFQTFQSYLQLFIDAPASNFHILITLEQDPSCVLYSGSLENQKINTLLPINDIYTNVKMNLVCKDFNQQNDQNMIIPLRSVRNSIDRGRMDSVIEDEIESQKQQSSQISNLSQQQSSVKKQQNKQDQTNSNLVVSINKDEKPFIRHKSQHIFLMRAQKVTQLRISNLNYNLRDEELFKIFYRQTYIQSQDKSATLFQKKPQIEVFAIVNENQVIFRRKNLSQDKNIYLTQNSQSIQEWTILSGYQKSLPQSSSKVIDFYVKISHVEEGSFYIYDKNSYYSIKSSLLLKQDAVLDEAGVVDKSSDKDAITQSVNKLLGEKYWHAFSIVGNDQFIERSRLTSIPHILKNLQ